MLAQVLGRLLRVEDDRGVEEAEEDDQRRVEHHVERPAVADRRHGADEPVRAALAGEARHGGRQEQERAGEDRRDDARGVELERQVRALAAEDAVALLALGVLDQDAPLRPLDEDDEGDDRHRHHDQEDDEQRRHGAGAAELEGADQRVRQVGDDADEDDERGAVADAAGGDLLAQPHQEQAAADDGDDRRDAEEPAGVGDRRPGRGRSSPPCRSRARRPGRRRARP